MTVRIGMVTRLEAGSGGTPKRTKEFDQGKEFIDPHQHAAAFGAVQNGPVLNCPFRKRRLANRADLQGLSPHLNAILVPGRSGFLLRLVHILLIGVQRSGLQVYCSGRFSCPSPFSGASGIRLAAAT